MGPSTETHCSAGRNTAPLQVSNSCPVQLYSPLALCWGSQTQESHRVNGQGCMKFGQIQFSMWSVASPRECGSLAALNRVMMPLYVCYLWDEPIFTCGMHSAMNVSWLITLSTKELKSSLYVLFGHILLMECPTFKHAILLLSVFMSSGSGQPLLCPANWSPATALFASSGTYRFHLKSRYICTLWRVHYLIKQL